MRNNLKLIVCLILGISSIQIVYAQHQVNDSVLLDTVVSLNEVTVTERKKAVKWDNYGIVADVANSDLKNEPDIKSLMRRIPGVIVLRDQIQIPGQSLPVYYIDDRKVLDFNEVEMLDVKNINSISVLLSPGVQYDSDGAPVVLIKMQRQHNKITMQLSPEIYHGTRNLSDDEKINIGYYGEKLDIWTTYRHQGLPGIQELLSEQFNLADTIWNCALSSQDREKSHLHSFQIGSSYRTEKSTIGLKFDFSYTRHNSFASSMFDLTNDQSLDTIMTGGTTQYSLSKPYQYHFNLYYTKELFRRLKLKFSGDYIRSFNTSATDATKMEGHYTTNSFSYNSESAWNVYAYQLAFGIDMKKAGNINVGTNISHVDGYSGSYYSSELTSGETKNKENKYSLFFSYNFNYKGLSMQAGLRYEWRNVFLKNVMSGTQSNDKYPNWIPHLTVSYKSTPGIYQTLAYSFGITRPQYSELNDNLDYINALSYSRGNVDLRNSIMHKLNYTFYWKWLYFNLGYAFDKAPIFDNLDLYPGKPYISIFYRKNENPYHILSGMLNVQHTLKFWEPSLSLMYIRDFFKYEHNGQPRKTEGARVYLYLNNVFRISKTFNLSFDYEHSFKGSFARYTYEPTIGLNLRLQKTFRDNQWSIVGYFNDILNKSKVRVDTYFKQTVLHARSTKSDSRKIGINIIYRFNHSLKKKKEMEQDIESAAKEEMNRLNMDE